ncbi:receiver box response regulator [Natronomonas pharaonis DSM 2160]|uniref:Receiver box response regulator n=1 Tax=Natronomonas pharaonis (strain ATCC 35678 / DSM 2160 / CIP 103997 / JCM 8858 / NBRC 14720 / NCIMB 2260 / Gabara) TaxID=348780 RepID=A0A1U7EWR4_NATPD|nr:response regulator [Natronomonas pharaonis]CAI49544.1 receiver box response regulator [Natronomonas pharaonis DSM 2160]
MADGDDKPTVLVVEDERALIELYVRWLENDYEVLTATGGEEALEQFRDDIDVALLDRLMPGMSGDEVLEHLREEVPDCKVAMVTAVEPDFDVISMGFDDYLTKPVEREELVETVEGLLSRTAFDEIEQELYALSSKQAALRSSKPKEELDESEEFSELQERIDELRGDLDAAMPDMEDDDFVAMVRDIEDGEDDAERGGDDE